MAWPSIIWDPSNYPERAYVHLSDQRGLVVHGEGWGENAHGTALLIDLENRQIIDTFQFSTDACERFHLSRISDTMALMTWTELYGGDTDDRAMIISAAGDTLSAGNNLGLNDKTMNPENKALSCALSSTVGLIWTEAGTKIHALSITGTTLAFTSEATLAEPASLARLSDTTALAQSSYYFKLVTVSGGVVSVTDIGQGTINPVVNDRSSTVISASRAAYIHETYNPSLGIGTMRVSLLDIDTGTTLHTVEFYQGDDLELYSLGYKDGVVYLHYKETSTGNFRRQSFTVSGDTLVDNSETTIIETTSTETAYEGWSDLSACLIGPNLYFSDLFLPAPSSLHIAKTGDAGSSWIKMQDTWGADHCASLKVNNGQVWSVRQGAGAASLWQNSAQTSDLLFCLATPDAMAISVQGLIAVGASAPPADGGEMILVSGDGVGWQTPDGAEHHGLESEVTSIRWLKPCAVDYGTPTGGVQVPTDTGEVINIPPGDPGTVLQPGTPGQAPTWGRLNLDDLGDVDTTSNPPADQSGMVYDAGLGLWIPAVLVRSLGDLSDVDLIATPPVDGDALVFNAGTWAPGQVSGGGAFPPPGKFMIGTTQYDDFSTALAAAVNGDTILCGAGTYTITSVQVIDKEINIQGVNKYATVFTGNLGFYAIFQISASASLKDISVENTNSSMCYAVQIHNGLISTLDVRINDCNINSNLSASAGYGLYIGQANRVRAENSFFGGWCAVRNDTYEASNNQFDKCYIWGNSGGYAVYSDTRLGTWNFSNSRIVRDIYLLSNSPAAEPYAHDGRWIVPATPVIAGWYDYDLIDKENASGVADHFTTAVLTYPSGWGQPDAPVATNTTARPSFWFVQGSNANTSWKFYRQTNITLESTPDPSWTSFVFGPTFFRDLAYTADVNYYFTVAADNGGLPSTNTYVRVHLQWNASLSVWRVQGESDESGVPSQGGWFQFSQPLVQPVWFRCALFYSGGTSVVVRAYWATHPEVNGQTLLLQAGTSQTWGRLWVQINQARGGGNPDYLYIGAVDYSTAA